MEFVPGATLPLSSEKPPSHPLGAFALACQGLVDQTVSMGEWLIRWELARAFLERSGLVGRLAQETRECLELWHHFGQQGQVEWLQRALGWTLALVPQWEHQAWIAWREGSPWQAEEGSPQWSGSRQGGRTRLVWTCPQCSWECSLDQESAAWESLPWPGPMSCPCCA